MKLAIVGTRNPQITLQEFCEIVNQHITSEIDTIVSGGAKGIDSYAAAFAKASKLNLIEFLPEYSKYGKPATMIRNQQIVDNSDIMLALPSKDSKGTYDSIRRMEKANKPVTIHII